MTPDTTSPEVLRAAARARALLAQPLAYLEPAPDGYLLRLSEDRRRRPALKLQESVFAALAGEGVLSPRSAGGWRLSRTAAISDGAAPPPGRPGVIEGERLVSERDGRLVARRANLGESPVAWLARRKDGLGRPYLQPWEAGAAERLAADVARAGVIGRLTMDWSGGPRGSGGWTGPDPAERNRFAKARVEAAMEAMTDDVRPLVTLVCLKNAGLEEAERALGLRRRTGRDRLQEGLRQLALHYGLIPPGVQLSSSTSS
jgi:hypothetical protein